MVPGAMPVTLVGPVVVLRYLLQLKVELEVPVRVMTVEMLEELAQMGGLEAAVEQVKLVETVFLEEIVEMVETV